MILNFLLVNARGTNLGYWLFRASMHPSVHTAYPTVSSDLLRKHVAIFSTIVDDDLDPLGTSGRDSP